MNFDFSEDEKALKDQARRVLAQLGGPAAVRRVMDSASAYEAPLWREMAKLGWLGAAIPENYGGQGLGYVALCALAEELGRALAPVPTCSSIYLAAEALLALGSEAQKREYLPKLADGTTISTLGLVEGPGPLAASCVNATVVNGKLSGRKLLPDGMAAQLAIIAARAAGGSIELHLLRLDAAGVQREPIASIDPSRPWALVNFTSAATEPLGARGADTGWPAIAKILQRAAIPTAFEQLGGADRCLELARDYALQREAFGRLIGQYQAVKHRLADVYVANELARSNVYYGAWALDCAPVDAAAREVAAHEIALAATVSRISATEAFERAARDNTQTHGGISATWAHDAHLYYRRARHLAVLLGTGAQWRDQLIDLLGNDTRRRASAA